MHHNKIADDSFHFVKCQYLLELAFKILGSVMGQFYLFILFYFLRNEYKLECLKLIKSDSKGVSNDTRYFYFK